ncbi:MAG: phage holin family protein [Clostridiales bacterium]|nr:phage holin family protein [Clostridiales bacterium]
MENWLEKGLKGLAAAGGFIAGLFGGWDGMLIALVVVMVIDYISGILVAVMNKSLKSENGGLNSKVGAKGIAKKCLILLMVWLATTLDTTLGEQYMFRNMVVWFYVANEGLSILENLALTDLPIPQGLKEILEQWKEKGNKDKIE